VNPWHYCDLDFFAGHNLAHCHLSVAHARIFRCIIPIVFYAVRKG